MNNIPWKVILVFNSFLNSLSLSLFIYILARSYSLLQNFMDVKQLGDGGTNACLNL